MTCKDSVIKIKSTLALALSLVLTACGGDDSMIASPTATTGNQTTNNTNTGIIGGNVSTQRPTATTFNTAIQMSWQAFTKMVMAPLAGHMVPKK